MFAALSAHRVRKNISVQKGEQVLFDEIRYFFYITNRVDYTGEQIVSLANGRCNQENVIAQLKNGVNAMRMPVDDLLSNWAYMVMTSLAWNLKAWFGLLLPNARRAVELIRMEFRRFLHAIVFLPAQIVRTGRRVIYRIMSYNGGSRISSQPGSTCAGSVPLSKAKLSRSTPQLVSTKAALYSNTATIRFLGTMSNAKIRIRTLILQHRAVR